jgi:hypothetical protein
MVQNPTANPINGFSPRNPDLPGDIQEKFKNSVILEPTGFGEGFGRNTN